MRRQQQRAQRAQRRIAMAANGAKRKVVVTGLGTFTSLGNDAETFFNNLLDGQCGIDVVSRFDPELSAVKISSEVRHAGDAACAGCGRERGVPSQRGERTRAPQWCGRHLPAESSRGSTWWTGAAAGWAQRLDGAAAGWCGRICVAGWCSGAVRLGGAGERFRRARAEDRWHALVCCAEDWRVPPSARTPTCCAIPLPLEASGRPHLCSGAG